MPQAIAAAREGRFESAFDLFLAGMSGPDFRAVFVRELGEVGLAEAVASSEFLFTAWLPHAEIRVLPGVSHAMPLENPPLVAAAIEEFVATG
jgi:pimeloyl-ACP methyl ester carboxylesterase